MKSINYYQLYKKYKSKYLNLKQTMGGAYAEEMELETKSSVNNNTGTCYYQSILTVFANSNIYDSSNIFYQKVKLYSDNVEEPDDIFKVLESDKILEIKSIMFDVQTFNWSIFVILKNLVERYKSTTEESQDVICEENIHDLLMKILNGTPGKGATQEDFLKVIEILSILCSVYNLLIELKRLNFEYNQNFDFSKTIGYSFIVPAHSFSIYKNNGKFVCDNNGDRNSNNFIKVIFNNNNKIVPYEYIFETNNFELVLRLIHKINHQDIKYYFNINLLENVFDNKIIFCVGLINDLPIYQTGGAAWGKGNNLLEKVRENSEFHQERERLRQEQERLIQEQERLIQEQERSNQLELDFLFEEDRPYHTIITDQEIIKNIKSKRDLYNFNYYFNVSSQLEYKIKKEVNVHIKRELQEQLKENEKNMNKSEESIIRSCVPIVVK